MNRPCLNSRSPLIPSPHIASVSRMLAGLLLLALTLISTGLAAEVPLRAFTASYDLYKGNMHVASLKSACSERDQLWRWRTDNRGAGNLCVVNQQANPILKPPSYRIPGMKSESSRF